VSKFFPIYYQWVWPQPVLLKRIDPGPPNMTHAVWNPRTDRRDMAHRMPVITPAYPSMCSTHNITASTMTVIKNEMLRGESDNRTALTYSDADYRQDCV
jgi:poly(A) polymerase